MHGADPECPGRGERADADLDLDHHPKHNGVATNFDATTGDKVAMGNYLDGLAAISPSFVTFDPDVDTVNWAYGKQSQAGPAVWNCGTDEANEQIGGAPPMRRRPT